MNRQETINSLISNPDIDVLIIGAGINGIGTFRDLALQGINVLLVDRSDFCAGASAASSHMAHGGIRYLENGEFRLVREAVQERNRLLVNAPHIVKPLPTTIPIFKWLSGLLNAPLKFLGLMDKPSERGATVIKAGLMMYDAYTSAQGTVPRHRFDGRAESLKRYPALHNDIRFTATYYDGLIQSPERLAVELVIDAVRASKGANAEASSARVVNYMSVAGASGNTVRLKDEVSGEAIDVRPQLVINAAGPWIDFANRAMGQETRFIGGTKGSHLVLDHPQLREAISDSEFFFENHDGRIVLICPLFDRVLVGTSDLRIDDPDDARCTDEEIDYFFGMVARVFPDIGVDRSHIVFTFSGVRPLPASDANSTGQISRDHSVRIAEPSADIGFPVYNLIGGKWTTFRAFAEQVTDKVLARLGRARQQSTRDLAIGGGRDYPQSPAAHDAWVAEHQARSGLSNDRITTLLERYGTRAVQVIDYIVDNVAADAALNSKPDFSHQEVAFIARAERVVHLDDFILRRSALGMLGQVTAPLLQEVADAIGETFEWSAEEKAAEVERTQVLLAERYRITLHDEQVILA